MSLWDFSIEYESWKFINICHLRKAALKRSHALFWTLIVWFDSIGNYFRRSFPNIIRITLAKNSALALNSHTPKFKMVNLQRYDQSCGKRWHWFVQFPSYFFWGDFYSCSLGGELFLTILMKACWLLRQALTTWEDRYMQEINSCKTWWWDSFLIIFFMENMRKSLHRYNIFFTLALKYNKLNTIQKKNGNVKHVYNMTADWQL